MNVALGAARPTRAFLARAWWNLGLAYATMYGSGMQSHIPRMPATATQTFLAD